MSRTSQARQISPDEDRDFWVASKVPEGYRVYQAGSPQRTYLVSGTADAPSCNCGAIQLPNQRLSERCPHIQAVFKEEAREKVESGDDYDPGFPASASGDPEDYRLPVQLMLKRSVSPDGRIDSLSVEFELPCDMDDAQTVVENATFMLSLQADIVERFLANQKPFGNGHGAPIQTGPRGNGNGNGQGSGHHQALPLGEPVHARLKSIDGMQTRNGWSYYINVQVNGQVVRLFGDRRRIEEYIRDAGHENLRNVRNIAKGVVLDLPCRVVLGRRENDKYYSVEEVMPTTTPQERYQAGRGRR